jgi:hypothetical protein
MVKKSVEVLKFPFLRELDKPILVLALDAEKQFKEPKFKNGYKFEKIAHQCAGLGCHHRYFYIYRLEFKNNKVLENALNLHNLYFGTSLGCLGPTLDDLVEYRKHLKSLLGVDCKYSWSDAEEAIYPIDIDWYRHLTKTKLPFNLDDILVFDTEWEKLCGSVNRWNLLILGENSD